MPESLYDEPPGGGTAGGSPAAAEPAHSASAGEQPGGGERTPSGAADGESVAEVLRGGLRRNLRIIAGLALALALLALIGQALFGQALFDAKRCEFSLDAVREDGDPPGLSPTVRLTGQNAKCSRQGCTGRIEVLAPLPGDPEGCPIWGSVCGHEFWENDEPANVVCRALGYTSGSLYNCAPSRPPWTADRN